MAKKPMVVRVNDKMQHGYGYVLTAPIGRNFDPEFRPELTQKQMLALGVFCGKYMTDCRDEFPASWFTRAAVAVRSRLLTELFRRQYQPAPERLAQQRLDSSDDPGWFQWYCRYYMGRRWPDEDARQIKRWKAIRRHVAQITRRVPMSHSVSHSQSSSRHIPGGADAQNDELVGVIVISRLQVRGADRSSTNESPS